VLFCSASFTNSYNVGPLPPAPLVVSTTTGPSTTGGTYGTPGGPSLTAGRFIAAPAAPVPVAAGAASRLLALSGTDSSVPLIAGCGLVALGAGAFLLGRRRIRHPAHRMG
jgi:hypothetical protein